MKLVVAALLLTVAPGLQDGKKAGELFQDALGQARESKKNVFLTFGSPG